MRSTAELALVLVATALAVPAQGTTWHVPAECPTIQAGIDSAAVGDTVLVVPDTYIGEGNRNLDFAGTNIVLSSAGGGRSATIDCQASGLGFNFHSGEDATSVVDGFTIANGDGPGNGGGAYVLSSSPTFVNCAFTDGDGANYGGGVYCESGSPTFDSCLFSGGEALYGGGVFCMSGGSPSFTDCVFSENVANRDGGAVRCSGAVSPTFTNCTFSENTPEIGGGGAISCDETSATIWGVRLWGTRPTTAVASGA